MIGSRSSIGLALWVGLLGFVLPAAAQPTAGEKAKLRAEAADRADTLIQKGQFADAVEPATLCVRLSRESDGAKHWKTFDAEQRLKLGQTAKAFPETKQKKLRESLAAEAEAKKAESTKPKESLEFARTALNGYRELLGEETVEVARMWHLVGRVDGNSNNATGARDANEKALKTRRKVLPDPHPDLGKSHNNLGIAQSNLGDNKGAIESYQEAIRIFKAALGVSDPLVEMGLNNLGNVQYDLREYEAAKQSYTEALAIRRKALPEDHPDIAFSLNNLGAVQFDLREYEAAKQSHTEALAIRRKALPKAHPDIAASLNELGNEQLHLREYEAAMKSHNEALAIRRKALPKDHPHIALSLYNLGYVENELREYEAAKQSYTEALAIYRKALPKDHLDIARSLNNLGNVQNELREYEVAKQSLSEALAIQRKALAKDHPNIATTVNNLGRVQNELREYEAARHSYIEALAIYRKVLPENHSNISRCLHDLSHIQFTMKDLIGAQKSKEEEIHIYRAVLPKHHIDIAQNLMIFGIIQHQLHDNNGAKKSYEEGLASLRIALPANEPIFVAALQGYALVQKDLGDLGGSRVSFEEAISRIRKSSPLDRKNVAEILYFLGDIETQFRMWKEAIAHYQEAVDIYRKMPDSQDKVAMNLTGLGETYFLIGDFSTALRNIDEAVAIARKVHSRSLAVYLTNSAAVRFKIGDYATARSTTDEAIAILCNRSSDENVELAIGSAQEVLCCIFIEQGDFKIAKKVANDVIAIRRKNLAKNRPEIAMSVINLGTVEYHLGEYENARLNFEQGLILLQNTPFPNLSYIASAMNNLGGALAELGEYSKAKETLQKAIAIRRKILPPDHPDNAESLNNVAMVCYYLRDLPSAESYWREARDMLRKTLPDNHPLLASITNNLGQAESDNGDFVSARKHFEEALKIRRIILPKNHPDLALSLSSLGRLHYMMGEWVAARNLFTEAAVIYTKAYPDGFVGAGLNLTLLADTLVMIGDTKTAIQRMEDAISILRRKCIKDHYFIAHALCMFADIFYSQNIDHDRAYRLLIEAINIYQAHFAHIATVQSEREQFLGAVNTTWPLDTLLSLFVLTGRGDARTAYKYLVRAKGAVSARQRWARLARSVKDPETVNLIRKLEEVNQQLLRASAAEQGLQGQIKPVDRTVVIHKLDEERRRIERDLAERSPAYRTFVNQPLTEVDEMLAEIPKDTVLIDFAVFSPRLPANGENGKRIESDQIVAFILHSGEIGVEMVPLGSAKALADIVDRWRLTYGLGKHPPSDGPDPALQLRAKLWEPLEKHFHAINTILISPAGALHGLPLAALPGKTPGKYLLDEYLFTIIPVPQVIPDMLKDAATHPANPSALVIGNVEFGELLDNIPGRRFSALPGTATEAKAVTNLFRSTFPGCDLTSLIGKNATKSAFSEKAPFCTHLLVSTHGFLIPSPSIPKMDSRSLQAQRRWPIGSSVAPDTYLPATRSALAFAGANSDPAGKAILTALEVMELDLRRVDIAVLSACETGLGKIEATEGMIGLQRALQVAGTRTTVTSLWKVPDQSTKALVVRFHENLWVGRDGKKMSRGESLREAQRWLITEWAAKNPDAVRDLRGGSRSGLVREDKLDWKPGDPVPPYLWAAFVLSGDWR